MYFGYCYKLYFEMMNQMDASLHCLQNGGHLVAAEQDMQVTN